MLLNISPKDKPLVWLHGEILTPPFSQDVVYGEKETSETAGTRVENRQ
jgi:hypothetical protein